MVAKIDIEVRADGYFNASRICKSSGKQWNHFVDVQSHQDHLAELSMRLDLPISAADNHRGLISTKRGAKGGIWIHSELVPRLKQWCSQKRKQTSSGYVYAVTSDVLDAVKIGLWSGSLDNLRTRYLTPYGPTLTFETAFVDDCVRAEAALHKQFWQQNLGGELFHKASLQAYKEAILGMDK
ncbi:hypothetical protein WJX74_005490 [Apatococcus lobatus]|uniref:KilA-N domain-containing protein n=1 Tax=Apatococcus lobatus TaxID=904363 RepID=A0AAW1R006_9CHLO